MDKFKKRMIITAGLLGLLLVGELNYKIANKPEIMEIPKEEKKETLAMYIQDTDGNYQMSNAKEFPKDGYVLNLEKSTCKNGGLLSQDSVTKKIKVSLSHNDQCSLYFDKEVPKIELGDITLKVKEGIPNFANPATTDETKDGLYAMEDDYGTSYYFRGTAPNNYVKFGTNASGEEMWWRIIRFNGDGSVRMQYDGAGAKGASTYTKGFALQNQRWNTYGDDTKYAGWMFGGANGMASTSKIQAQRNETDLDIKIAVDNWYKSNIVDTGYSNYIADVVFCNDRSTPGQSETGYGADTGLGYGLNYTAYGVTARTNVWNTEPEKVKPQFTCPQENDKFTVEKSSEGNGALTYPVGLITADEIVAAGSGKYDTVNKSYYLYKENGYWSFSPCYVNGDSMMICHVYTDGSLYRKNPIFSTVGASPVINLKAEYLSQMKGTGMSTDPFRLS